MNEESIQQNGRDNWRVYDLAPQAIIIMPYGVLLYSRDNGEAHVMQRVPINQLQNEANRLIPENIPAPTNMRSALNESLYSVVLSQLLKPTGWTPPVL